MIFEAKDYSRLGRLFQKLKVESFFSEYNEHFNAKQMQSSFNRDVHDLRIGTKILELRAMFNALSTGDAAPNSKARFKEIFGIDWNDDYDIINKRVKFYLDKMQTLPKVNDNGTITFSELVAIIETSRGIPIDREMRLFEFKNIYNIELEKWQQT